MRHCTAEAVLQFPYLDAAGLLRLYMAELTEEALAPFLQHAATALQVLLGLIFRTLYQLHAARTCFNGPFRILPTSE